MRGIELCMPKMPKPHESFTDQADSMRSRRFLTAARPANFAERVLCRLALLLLISGLALSQGGVVNATVKGVRHGSQVN
jgi:hypothetical protein